MTNKVVSSVCITLSEKFGLDYKIYKELVKQNLQEPCFFVECISPKRTQYLNNRYYRQHKICISYFPFSENNRFECNAIIDELLLAVNHIYVDGNLVLGKNIRFEFNDAKSVHTEYSHTIMQAFIDYDFFTIECDEDVPIMGDLTQI